MRRLILLAAALSLVAAKPHDRNKDAYILAAGENTTISGGMNIEEWKAIHRAYPGDVMWVRRNGNDYLIRDETLLLRMRALFGPEMALTPEQKEIGREEARIDREADRLEDARSRTAAEERRLEELHARQRELAKREKALDDKQEELERIAEREMWQLVDRAIGNGMAKRLSR